MSDTRPPRVDHMAEKTSSFGLSYAQCSVRIPTGSFLQQVFINASLSKTKFDVMENRVENNVSCDGTRHFTLHLNYYQLQAAPSAT